MSPRDDERRHHLRSDRAADAHRNTPRREQPRIAWAQACADRHSVRELHFLDLAVQARDESVANAYELIAYEAYKDALAIKEEHGLED